ncbi:MAG: cell division protein FtsZ, partial [Rhodospirillales bacterium]|nr:cell division protein FtsZ [Rhodospirillales bacterium]
NRIRDEVDPEANIIFGSTFDASLDGKMRVSVVATGIEAAAQVQPRPMVISLVANRPAGRPAVQPSAPTEGAAAVRMDTVTHAAMAAPAHAVRTQAVQAYAVQPVVAEAAPAPITAEAPAAPVRAEQPFIAPRPVEPTAPAARSAQPAAADPFAAAAMANGGRDMTREKRRGPTLFERVTGTGRARAAAPATPVAPPAPMPARPAATASAAPVAAAAAAPAPVAPVAAPAQPRLGGLDPTDRIAPTKVEDDLLDIPAFLRRQAN